MLTPEEKAEEERYREELRRELPEALRRVAYFRRILEAHPYGSNASLLNAEATVERIHALIQKSIERENPPRKKPRREKAPWDWMVGFLSRHGNLFANDLWPIHPSWRAKPARRSGKKRKSRHQESEPAKLGASRQKKRRNQSGRGKGRGAG
jgi:hypothetical protein